MESDIQPALKKPRLKANYDLLDLEVTECVREFQLPQQYPSMIAGHRTPKSNAVNITPKVKNVTFPLKGVPYPKGGLQNSSNKGCQNDNKDLKNIYQVKTLDGKSLGEVKLRITPGGEEKFKASILSVPKTTATTDSPILKIKPIVTQSTGMNSGTMNSSINLDGLEINNVNDNTPQGLNVQLSKKKDFFIKISPATTSVQKNSPVTSMNNITSTINNPKPIKPALSNKPKIIKNLLLHSKNDINKSNVPIHYIKIKTLPDGKKVIVNTNPEKKSILKSMLEPQYSNIRSVSPISTHSTTNMAEKMVSMCADNRPNCTMVNINNKINGNNFKEQYDKKMDLAYNIERLRANGISAHLTYGNLNTPPEFDQSVVEPENDLTIFIPEKSTIDNSNIFTINNEDINGFNYDDGLVWVTNNDNLDYSIQNNTGFDDIPLTIQANNPEEINEISDLLYKTKNSDGSLLDDRLSILEKAVRSVKDENLRTEALRALQDCGVKIQKCVSSPQPTNSKIINESFTQTEVFSLLEPGKLIEASETNENITRLKVGYNATHSKKFLPLVDSILEEDFKNKLDLALDKFIPKEKINRVEKALKPTQEDFAKQIVKQLEADLRLAQYHDYEGLLGIHHGVQNNNLKLVQKFLLVMRALKLNIDTPTGKNVTSLELALTYDVNPQIVKLLLDEGSQPLSKTPFHNSALHLAAKKNSKLFFLLIKYITDENRKFLNIQDAHGFAVIHYCAQLGNLQGIRELIKAGANVNIQEGKSGRTPLFYACEAKGGSIKVQLETFYQIAHELINAGADSNIPTYSRHTCLNFIDNIKSHSLKEALCRAAR